MTTSSLAQVAKLVDAGDSKSPAARCVGSSPTLGTTKKPLISGYFFACRKLILESNILINQDFCWFCHVLGIGSNQTRGSAKVGFIYSGLNVNQDKARQRRTGLKLIHYTSYFSAYVE